VTVSYAKILSVAAESGYTAPQIQIWKSCRCHKKHRSVEKIVACRLSGYESNGQSSTKSVVNFFSSYPQEEWVVFKKLYSGDYYSTHNGKRRNNGYFTYDVQGLPTLKDAMNYYHVLKTRHCFGCGSINNHREGIDCPNVVPVVAQVVLPE
jgi:hypothetical protein